MSADSNTPPVAPLEHYVSTAPFEPEAAVTLTPEQERYYMASQTRMIWMRLRRHRLFQPVLLALGVAQE